MEISAAPVVPAIIGPGLVLLALQSGEIEARHLTDGRQLWRQPLKVEQPIEIDGERVAFAAAGEIRVFSAAEGKPLWSRPTGTLTAPLLASGGWVIAATGEELIAFRGADGEEVWRQASRGQTERATIEGATLYIPLSSGAVRALDLTTGAEKWSTQLGGAPTEVLALVDRLYVGSADKHFYCLDPATGRVEWVFTVGAPLRGRPAADDRHVYTGAMDNQVRAYDRRSGALRWHADARFRPTIGPTVIGPIVAVSATAAVELKAWSARTGASAAPLPFGEPLAQPVAFSTTGPTVTMAVVTGGLNEKWKLSLYGPPMPTIAPPTPLTVLPGVLVTIRPPGR